MARSRGSRRAPPDTFANTDISINLMERAVVYRTVDRDLWSPDDILDWLIPPEAIHHLRAAYQHMQGRDSMSSWDARLYRVEDSPDAPWVRINISTAVLCCLPPEDMSLRLGGHYSTAKSPAIMAALKEIHTIVEDHNVLRRIVKWFNENRVTASFARHYFPALGSLLHADHAFHQTDGARFADKVMPHWLATDLRRAPEIIAKGLFCSPRDHGTLEGRSYCTVQFGENNPSIALFAKVK